MPDGMPGPRLPMAFASTVAAMALLLPGCAQPAVDPQPTAWPPPHEPLLAVEGAAVSFLPCPAAGSGHDPMAGASACHDVLARLRLPAGAAEAAIANGWTGVSHTGGVYAGQPRGGAIGVVPGGSAAVRLGFALPDGEALAAVRWTDGNLTLHAPVDGYLDAATLAPPMRLERAERASAPCRFGGCTTLTIAVDNAGRTLPFPPTGLQWALATSWWAGPFPDVAAEGEVPPGGQGTFTLTLPQMPAAALGVLVGGWAVHVLDVPAHESLPLRDEGALLTRLDAWPMAPPATDPASGLPRTDVQVMPTSPSGWCTPFRGTLHLQLDWQPGPVMADPAWLPERDWTVDVEPGDTDPLREPWCSLVLPVEGRALPAQASYRLRLTATPQATGESVSGVAYFAM